MKKILCFGDSNTYGFIPENGRRYDENTRWTGMLQNLSKDKYEIIEAGCNNRTGFSDNPAGIKETGYKILPLYLTKKPDIVIVAIGINDLQPAYNISFFEIKTGLENMIDMIRQNSLDVEIIIVCPSKITDNLFHSYFATLFDKTSVEKSKHLSAIYKNVAQEKNCIFIDLNQIANVSDKDGLHYEAGEHKKIAETIFKTLENLTIY